MKPPREPVFNVPGVVLALLVLLIGIHGLRQLSPADLDGRVVAWLAFVPIRLTALIDPYGVANRLATWAASTGIANAPRDELAHVLVRSVALPAVPTVLTYACLHGSWTHVGLNAVWLLAFGTPVARRFGPARFVAFLSCTAVAGSLTHWVLFPYSPEPLVGASAAVSGCMGAALRFAFRGPAADAASGPRATSLAKTLRDRRALSFLLAWFVSNALFGIGSISFGLSDQPVAWQAHIGGFLTGLVLFRWFDPRPLLRSHDPEPDPDPKDQASPP